jgi:uncharacterized protein
VALYYLDASALAKRYLAETGSGWVRGITNPAAANTCWISALSGVEVLGALYGGARTGAISRAQAAQMEVLLRHDLAALFQAIAPIQAIINDAMRLVSAHPLRAYDAVQLATALYLRSQSAASGGALPTFVAADQDLIRAATAEGLSADDPNLHP